MAAVNDIALKFVQRDPDSLDSAQWLADERGGRDEIAAARGIGFAIALGSLFWIGLACLLVRWLG